MQEDDIDQENSVLKVLARVNPVYHRVMPGLIEIWRGIGPFPWQLVYLIQSMLFAKPYSMSAIQMLCVSKSVQLRSEKI